jgi:secondary thiamine-phosphate synthase enzyme
MSSLWFQHDLLLPSKSRGVHLITSEILSTCQNSLQNISIGLFHLFSCHTSCSITINENTDSDIRKDLEFHYSRLFPDSSTAYRHADEGSDDAPAHIKCSSIGCELTVPIKNGALCLGTWQGFWLCEHRNNGGRRKLIITINGMKQEKKEKGKDKKTEEE